MKAPRYLTILVSAAVVLGAALPAAAGSSGLDAPSLTAAATVRAPEAWAQGVTGEGVGIALVDTGVSPRPQLGDRVLGQVDTSGPGRRTDGHGHGTFMAGLMVGDHGPGAADLAISPDAHLVSFKVADHAGETSLERLLTALAAVRGSAEDLGIRVVVLALGGPADDVPDPVEVALEQLWADGLVVVVASGNDGQTLAEPGTSPYLITVGATDDRGTADRDDDVVASWSGHGRARDGNPKPDMRAPGVSLVSVRMPGSTADRQKPDSRIEGRWFRGSGTSMAAAVTAGAAALLLDAQPALTPDEVKGRLMVSSQPTADDPAGTIDVVAAMAAEGAEANGHLPKLTAVPFSADHAPLPDEAKPVSVRIDAQWFGSSWVGSSWVASSWVGSSWVGSSWVGSSWVGSSWVDLSWNGSSWVGSSWVDQEWAGSSWVGSSWVGSSWVDSAWTADRWVGHSWTAADFS